MTLIHFKIDNLLNNILRHLNVKPVRQGYWNLCNKILEISNISITGTEKDILTAFANLRNSLHGNSVHRTDSLSLNVSGINFNFIKDKKVECAGWEHITILLEANIAIVKQVLLSQPIVDINEEIKDDFAFQI